MKNQYPEQCITYKFILRKATSSLEYIGLRIAFLGKLLKQILGRESYLKYRYWTAELGTRQCDHTSSPKSCWLLHYSMSIQYTYTVFATPFWHQGFKFFCFFSCHWSSITMSRCREANKVQRAQFCCSVYVRAIKHSQHLLETNKNYLTSLYSILSHLQKIKQNSQKLWFPNFF